LKNESDLLHALVFPEYGGMGLDFSYNIALAEELGNINSGGVASAFGVQTDMATPAFAK
jgi:citronellyl-CoA dehydrogenase